MLVLANSGARLGQFGLCLHPPRRFPEPKKENAITLIQVRVKPNSRIRALEPVEGGTWLARLRSPPVDGKANAELIALVADHFKCRRSAVSIRRGASGRNKWLRIDMAQAER
jgi:uncharacterized protein (TIGR00251 family)